MKNVKLISLAIAMLLFFGVEAQEKPNSAAHSEQNESKQKDTLATAKTEPQNSRIVICAPSKSSLLNGPIYVIDGKIIDAKAFSKINPNSVKAIKIFKGNEATGLFGCKAINGAIFITTKDQEEE